MFFFIATPILLVNTINKDGTETLRLGKGKGGTIPSLSQGLGR